VRSRSWATLCSPLWVAVVRWSPLVMCDIGFRSSSTFPVLNVRHWLQVQFNIPGANFQIHRFFPEDFLISFSFYDDMLRVLHDPSPSVAPFSLVFKRWHRQALASAESLLYQVTVAICGLLAHVWSLASAWKILGKSCSNLQCSAATVAKVYLRRFVVTAWCVHPDLIPREVIVYVPEPKEVHVRGPPLFLDPKDVIHHNRPMLRYRVRLDIAEVVDWHVSSDMSSSDSDSSS
jgi:hypothetical protein